MEDYSQHTIEYYFGQYQVSNPDQKAKILLEVTDLIYDRNMHVVKLEKETDEYRRNQILAGIKELEDKIAEVFREVTAGK